MPRVYMRFEWLAGWRVSFLDGSKVLPRALLFHSDEKLLETAEKGGALKSLADRQALEHAMVQGRGGVHLELSYPQFATLQRHKGQLKTDGDARSYGNRPDASGGTAEQSMRPFRIIVRD